MAAVLKRWTGSAWEAKPLKYWTGSAWATKQLKYWNGSAWIGAAAGFSPPFQDNFNRADAALEASTTASGGWTWVHDGLIASGLTIASNQLRGGTGSAAGSAYKTPDVGSANHYVQFKPAPAGAVGPFICCRLADLNNFVGARFASTGTVEIYRRVASTLNVLQTFGAGTWTAGDTLRLECSGTNWILKKNGAIIGGGPIADATLTSNGTGAVGRSVAGILCDDFEAGVLSVYQDSFDRANANLEASTTASGGWTWTHDGVILASMVITSNALRCNTALTTGSAYKTPALASADQYVQHKVTSLTAATGPFICCRLQDASNFVGIRTGNGGSNGQIEVYRRVAGSLSNVYTSAASAVALNDIVRLEVSGNNFTVRKNGVVVTGPTAIGATLTNVGTGVVARSSTTVTIEDFEAGIL